MNDYGEHNNPFSPVSHYHGDVVRRLFIAAGVAILLAALIDETIRPFYLFVGAFGVLAFVILAGLTSPTMRTTMTINMLAAAAMFLVFEYLSIDAYVIYQSFFAPIFLLRQLTAVMFLLAVYFSTKTLRGTDMRTPDHDA